MAAIVRHYNHFINDLSGKNNVKCFTKDNFESRVPAVKLPHSVLIIRSVFARHKHSFIRAI